MDCEIKIELPHLTSEEAWALFKMHAKTINNDFDSIGEKIVDKCKGLPIAIMTVGSTLKGKSIEEWKSTLYRLRHPPQVDSVENDLKTLYASLEVIYDNLLSPLSKSLFRLCSIFPKDHEIHVEDLIRIGKGTLELGDTIITIDDARTKILAALEMLSSSCLLMHTNKQTCVKLHDVVRDAALWISKKKRQEVLVDNHAVSNMLVRNSLSLNYTKALSLWNLDENFKLFNKFCYPTLEILLLQPHGFIEDLEAIKALKVLALTTYGFERRLCPSTFCSIPRSIVSLTNLHTLCLRGKKLGDISFLGELKGLEILDLRGSLFDALPIGIVGMKKLKLLDVFHCEIQKCPLEVIGSCYQLEELYFWDERTTIPAKFSLPSLKRYVIYDPTCSFTTYEDPFMEYWGFCIEAIRALCIQGFKVSALGSSMKDVIPRANCLWLENCGWDHKDINSEIKHLRVSCCQDKRFIIDNLGLDILQTQQVFSHLITLRLSKMYSLEKVFQDSSIRYSLPMLEELCIESCPELKNCIFTHATITNLPKLRKLEIDYCAKVKWLFSYPLASNCPSLEELQIRYCSELERLVDGNNDEEATHRDQLPLLKLKELNLLILPKLIEIFGAGFYYKLGSLHDKQERPQPEHDNERVEVVNSELCSIRLDGLPELEFIWKGPTKILSLHKLEHVTLRGCPRLKNIFTLATIASFPKLRALKVLECKEWEGIFCEESLKNLPSSSNICFPKLNEINISGCDKARWLLSYPLASYCHSLEKLSIFNCPALERLVDGDSNVEAEHDDQLPLLKLKEVNLQILPKLREIFRGGFEYRLESLPDKQECPQHEYVNDEVRAVNSELCSMRLYDLPELEFIWKGPPQIVWLHRLEHVSLQECPRLKSVFTLVTVASLPKLRELRVFKCDEWEGIFCEESLKKLSSSSSSSSSFSHIVCFPRLEVIHIFKCHKVRRLFSSSLASRCPSLKKIIIYDCSQLEGVVQDYEGEATARHATLFPSLNVLGLKALPKLREVCQSYRSNRFQYVTKIIQDCPNIGHEFPDEYNSSSDQINK